MDLLAKSVNQGGTTLKDHLLESARSALTVADISVVPLNKELIRIASFISGLFHDLGKAANGFQAMIQIKEVKKWPESTGGFRHEIISAALVYRNLENLEKWKENQIYFKSIFLAVISHHKSYKRPNEKTRPIPENQFFGKPLFQSIYREIECNKHKLSYLWKELVQEIKKDSWGNNLILHGWLPEKLNIPNFDELKNFLKEIDSVLDGYYQGHVSQKIIEKKYSIEELMVLSSIRAFLITGDHLSSGSMFNIVPTPAIDQYSILDKEAIPYHFQVEAKSYKGSSLMIAPTGSGKTEAALFWASNNQKTINGDGKLFYVLPFSASINAMVKRIHEILNVEGGLVGIYHSKSAEHLYSIIEEEMYSKNNNIDNEVLEKYEDIWSRINVKSNYETKFSDLLLSFGNERNREKRSKGIKRANIAAVHLYNLTKEVFYPIKVTTPHQLLKGILQGKGWECIVTDFYQGIFIFDEIHSYEPNIVGLIFGLIKILIENFQAKILIMSATFPQFLINKLNEVIPKFFMNIIIPKLQYDRVVLDKKRHNVQVKDIKILDFVKSFDFDNYLDNKKQFLIICNTVNNAQNIYKILADKFSNKEIILFHSRFKQKDRNEIEKKVINHKTNEELKIVIATQVVEVSLDIDFDYGICEISPLDSLIQRLGRINRKGKKDCSTTNIWITRNETVAKFIYEENLMNYSFELIKSKSEKPLSEPELVKMVDELYTKFPWTSEEDLRFKNAFEINLIQNFNRVNIPGSYRRWIDDVLDIDSNIEVILEEDVSDYKKKMEKDFIGVNGYKVRIRLNKKRLPKFDDKLPPILEKKFYSYDKTFGLEYLFI